jgi:hypothetical protein
VSSQEYSQLIQDRYQAFRKPDGPGTVKSSCFLGNFHGTPEDAEAIVESPAAEVLKALKGCNKKASSNSPVLVHKRDLEVIKEMYDRGKVNNLGHQPNDFWTEQRKAAHAKKIVDGGGSERGRMVGTERDEHHQLCVDGGGSERGRMVGTKRDEHHQLSVAGGGSEQGRMVGTKRENHYNRSVNGGANERGRMDEGSAKKGHVAKIVTNGGSKLGRMVEGNAKKKHVAKIVAKNGSTLGHMAEGTDKEEFVARVVAKGGIPKGPMIGTELADHRAIISEGVKKTNAVLFRLANGKKDQEHKWTVSSHLKGNAVIYTFSNGNDDPIIGKGVFEDYLLKSYLSEDLTKDGKRALVEMQKRRIEKDKEKAKYARKKQRAN